VNANSFRALEFETIRALLLSDAGSPRGRALLQSLQPSPEPAAVRAALARTSEAVAVLRSLGAQPYHDLPDVEEAVARGRIGGLHLEPGVLKDVASFVEGASEIARRVASCGEAPTLAGQATTVAEMGDLARAIRRAILPSGEVADDASPRLAELRRSLVRLRAQLGSVMESYLHGRESDRILQDKVVTTRNDRYVLILKAEHRGQLPGIIHGASGSGASIFVEPLPAVELNNDIVSASDAERAEVVRVLQELTSRVAQHADALEHAITVLGALDAAQAMAQLARRMDAHPPRIGSELRVELIDARHPLLMASLTERIGVPRRTSREPVPVTILLRPDAPALVVSGPNTGGKTVALKTVGLLSLMAQSGLHIPASPDSVLPVFRRVYADIGDDQSIAENLSTFSAHLAAIVEMTRDLAVPALVLLDEAGAGTDPTEGGALGVAIVEGFRQRGAMVLATTHHGLMKAYSQSTPGVACASFGYDPVSFEPTYRLRLGEPGRSLAMEMAERLGLPAEMVADARGRRDEKDAQAEALLTTLEPKEATLRQEGERISGLRREAEAVLSRAHAAERELLARKRSEVEAFARELRRRADEAAREAAAAIQQAVERVEASRRSAQSAGTKARSEALRRIREQHEAILEDESLGLPREPEQATEALAVGARVRLAELPVVGEVLALHGAEGVEVAVGGKRLQVSRTAIAAVLPAVSGAAGRGAPPAARRAASATISKTGAVPAEVNLIGLRVDEALPRLDKLLDDAALSDRREIRVIHGFGSGRLRQAVVALLDRHPLVQSHRPGGPSEGGGGATVVELKD